MPGWDTLPSFFISRLLPCLRFYCLKLSLKYLAHRLGPTPTSSPQSGQAAKDVVFLTIHRRQEQHLGCRHSSGSAQSRCLRMDQSRWYYILHPRSFTHLFTLFALPEFLPVEREQNSKFALPFVSLNTRRARRQFLSLGFTRSKQRKKKNHQVKGTLSLNPGRDSKDCRIPRSVSGKAALGI